MIRETIQKMPMQDHRYLSHNILAYKNTHLICQVRRRKIWTHRMDVFESKSQKVTMERTMNEVIRKCTETSLKARQSGQISKRRKKRA